MQKITPCLWFDGDAEEAMQFYSSVFPDFKALKTLFGPDNRLLVLTCQMHGQEFSFLNGGPDFKFNEAVSFVVNCETQEEVDYFWNRLSEGGETSRCAWLKDRFGLSWQIVPGVLIELLGDPDRTRAQQVMTAMMGMDKIDIAALRAAYAA